VDIDDVARASQHMAPVERAVFVLCTVLDWRPGDVAELLGAPVADVRATLRRVSTAAREPPCSGQSSP
jgi:DNA-directed RNA polymerase specialized sigma24 family protein